MNTTVPKMHTCFLPLVLLLSCCLSGVLCGQSSRHTLGFLVGANVPPTLNLFESAGELTLRYEADPAYLIGLRYSYLFTEEFALYVGGASVFNSGVAQLFRPGTAGNGGTVFGSFPVNGRVLYGELGISYARRVGHRLSLVGEIGGQFVSVRPAGTIDGVILTRNRVDENLRETYFAFQQDGYGLALAISPGIRYDLGPYVQITLRWNYVVSNYLLQRKGLLEAPDPVEEVFHISRFEREYGLYGLLLMGTYRF